MRGRVRGVTGHTRIAIERGWEVAASPAGELDGPNDLSQLSWSPAYVPGTAASALPDRSDYDALDWWWRVPLDPDRSAGAVLGLDGLATLWDAWLDGAHVASGDSMWAARELALDKPAEELVIRCRSLTAELATKRPRPRWKVPMLEQQQLRWFRTTLLGRTPGWSPPWPAVGPWRPIWLERRVHDVGRVSIDASLDGTTGLVSIDAVLEADRATLVVTRDGQRFEGKLSSEGVWTGEVRVPDATLWWPHTHGEPARYHVAIEAQRGNDSFVIDLGHTGFRTIQLEPDFTVRVNGTAVFCRGACWTPIDARTLHATSAQYDAAVARCARGGMNMLRVSGTMLYEHDAFLDALDSHGVLLWQDLMFANMDYPDELDVAGEVREQAARWQARPSLAIVCGNSEGAQQAAMFGAPRDRWEPPLFHRAIPELVAEILPRVAVRAVVARAAARSRTRRTSGRRRTTASAHTGARSTTHAAPRSVRVGVPRVREHRRGCMRRVPRISASEAAHAARSRRALGLRRRARSLRARAVRRRPVRAARERSRALPRARPRGHRRGDGANVRRVAPAPLADPRRSRVVLARLVAGRRLGRRPRVGTAETRVVRAAPRVQPARARDHRRGHERARDPCVQRSRSASRRHARAAAVARRDPGRPRRARDHGARARRTRDSRDRLARRLLRSVVRVSLRSAAVRSDSRDLRRNRKRSGFRPGSTTRASPTSGCAPSRRATRSSSRRGDSRGS